MASMADDSDLSREILLDPFFPLCDLSYSPGKVGMPSTSPYVNLMACCMGLLQQRLAWMAFIRGQACWGSSSTRWLLHEVVPMPPCAVWI